MTAPRRAAALLLLFLSSVLHAASDPAACWRELEYAAGNHYATASSTLSYLKPSLDALRAQLQGAQPDEPAIELAEGTMLLRASFDAMMSHGEMRVWYERDSGRALQILRAGGGRESRRKLYRFLADGVWRERRAPDGGGAVTTTAGSWPVRSRTLIPYPRDRKPEEPVLNSLQLIAEAARFAAAPESPAPPSYLVLADTHFYRVELHALPVRTIDSDWLLQSGDGERRISGPREVLRVALKSTLLDGQAGEDPLRLLELEGDLQIAIDRETGLPVRVQGTWMQVGTVTVGLVRARLTTGCDG